MSGVTWALLPCAGVNDGRPNSPLKDIRLKIRERPSFSQRRPPDHARLLVGPDTLQRRVPQKPAYAKFPSRLNWPRISVLKPRALGRYPATTNSSRCRIGTLTQSGLRKLGR